MGRPFGVCHKSQEILPAIFVHAEALPTTAPPLSFRFFGHKRTEPGISIIIIILE